MEGIQMSKYICIFCNERKHTETAYKIYKTIGICRGCYASLGKTAPSMPYPGTRNIAYIMSPFEYKGNMRKTILDFKFNNCRAYAPLFAELMKEYIDSYNVWDSFDFIVPVPLHKQRMRERGYNQSELIAEHLSEYLSIPIRTDLIKRIRATARQSVLKKIDRVLNVQGAFSCKDNMAGKRILLFDDISTTGNTLQACADALDKANAEFIGALTLAIYDTQKLPIIMY